MKVHLFLSYLLVGLSAASAVGSSQSDATTPNNELWKRKGGGGGGGRGGGGGGGGGGSRGSGGSSSRPSSPPRPGQPGFPGAGAPRRFGGGKYYGGGAVAPYRAGSRSPGGIAPVLFVGAAALAFWPGIWLYSVYTYNYPNSYRFHNQTRDEEEDLPVICGCAEDLPCACDENDDDQYLSDLIGTGAYQQLNHSQITVGEVNGTKHLLINGTLPEGTEPPVPGEENATAGLQALVEALGYWPVVAASLAAVYLS